MKHCHRSITFLTTYFGNQNCTVSQPAACKS